MLCIICYWLSMYSQPHILWFFAWFSSALLQQKWYATKYVYIYTYSDWRIIGVENIYEPVNNDRCEVEHPSVSTSF